MNTSGLWWSWNLFSILSPPVYTFSLVPENSEYDICCRTKGCATETPDRGYQGLAQSTILIEHQYTIAECALYPRPLAHSLSPFAAATPRRGIYPTPQTCGGVEARRTDPPVRLVTSSRAQPVLTCLGWASSPRQFVGGSIAVWLRQAVKCDAQTLAPKQGRRIVAERRDTLGQG
jgi:hypothetical protein